MVGEDRFIGLYASSIYNTSATRSRSSVTVSSTSWPLPVTRGLPRLQGAAERIGNLPRDELIQAREEELLATGLGVLEMQERDMLRLFVRRDVYGRFFSCMVYVTKER